MKILTPKAEYFISGDQQVGFQEATWISLSCLTWNDYLNPSLFRDPTDTEILSFSIIAEEMIEELCVKAIPLMLYNEDL